MTITLNSFTTWLSQNEDFLEELGEKRRNPKGFYFDLIRESDQDSFKNYLAVGQMFYHYITAAETDDPKRISAIKLSEEHEHALHNAAVLWIEESETETVEFAAEIGHKNLPKMVKSAKLPKDFATLSLPDEPDELRLLYKLLLQRLWLEEVVASFKPKPSSSRISACKVYLLQHTTLGKVVVSKSPTQFHGDGRIRKHPGYWGLFLLGNRGTGDRGVYKVDTQDKEKEWLEYLVDKQDANLPKDIASSSADKLTKENLSYMSDLRGPVKNYFICEKVPRLFDDRELVDPGFYLHRPKAHGRDDFMVLVTGTTENSRKCMVFCTKGVGIAPEVTPSQTAGQLLKGWDANLLPFYYTAKQGSWSSLGFCFVEGNLDEPGETGETEIATVDFDNFGQIYEHVVSLANSKKGIYKSIQHGFVEPYVCIQISCLNSNRSRMYKPMLDAVKSGKIGWPTQVSTGAPHETSLRIYKRLVTDPQNYDYSCPDLELREWERCFKLVPLSENMNELIDADRNRIQDDNEKDELKRRLEVSYRMMTVIVASYAVFISKLWGTDTSTGSFSGRNFNSGPRDSNQWGDLVRKYDGDNAFNTAEKVDLGDLKVTISDCYKAAGAYDFLKELEADEKSSVQSVYVSLFGALGHAGKAIVGKTTSKLAAKALVAELAKKGEPARKADKTWTVVDEILAPLRTLTIRD